MAALSEPGGQPPASPRPGRRLGRPPRQRSGDRLALGPRRQPRRRRRSGDVLTSIARITGLLSAYLALIQVILLARVPALERLVGFDRLSVWHRWNGHACLDLVLAHVLFSVWGYALLDKFSLPKEISTMLGGGIYPGMITATVGTALLIAVVATSIVIVKRRLRYEWWYAVHLLAYAGIALAWFHQIPTGNELVLDHDRRRLLARALRRDDRAARRLPRRRARARRAALPAARRRRRRRGPRGRLALDHRARTPPAARACRAVLPLAVPDARPLVEGASVLAVRCARRPLAAHHGQGARRRHARASARSRSARASSPRGRSASSRRLAHARARSC